MSNQHTIYGYHPLIQWLHQKPSQIKKIYIKRNTANKRVNEIKRLAQPHNIPVEMAHRELPNDINHQGMMAETAVETHTDIKSFLKHCQHKKSSIFLLILDGVQDPHNLGACLRTACVMGVDAVIAPKDRAVGLTPTVEKVASGATLHVPFLQVTNLARTMIWLKEQGIWLYGASEQSDTCLYDVDLTGSIAWVMGSESHGLRRLTREHCDTLVHIPAANDFSTLNVSVATGICLAETMRQKRRINIK